MADLLADYSNEPPSDPDARATITDFIDYTEYFPSDLFRSLTLIGKLDGFYEEDTAKIHELTKTYGFLPSMPAAERPDPQKLRSEISGTLDHAIRCREAAYAESERLCNTADNLYNRLVNIRKKLVALPKPPSRDPTPVPQPRSPYTARTRKLEERTPKLKLVMDGMQGTSTNSRPKKGMRRTIVPGDLLPPLEPLSPGAVDSDPETSVSPMTIRHKSVSQAPEKVSMVRDKTPKAQKTTAQKIKLLKVPKTHIQPPGPKGTNVHSTVAGISVSNAMAALAPPPENPPPGSRHAPWLKLTEWELNGLRKKMKKNADWVPSETMVRRELAEKGRGREHFERAKREAEDRGEEFLDEEPDEFLRPCKIVRAVSLKADEDDPLRNRGMRLNEAKKLKREKTRELEEAAKAAAAAAVTGGSGESSTVARIVAETTEKDGNAITATIELDPGAADTRKPVAPTKKRKAEDDIKEEEPDKLPEPSRPAPKKLKLTQPAAATSSTNPAQASATSDEHAQTSVAPRKQSEPPADKTSKPRPKRLKSPAPLKDTTSTRTTSASLSPTTAAPMHPPPAPRPTTELSSGRPRSSRSTAANTPAPGPTTVTSISLTLPSKKAASAEPQQPPRRLSLRRVSNASADTPNGKKNASRGSSSKHGAAAAGTQTTAASRRPKRPAPGFPTSVGDNGGAKVTLSRSRGGKPAGLGVGIGARRAANASASAAYAADMKQEESSLPDDEDVVDPDEPRYCVCNGVSAGRMVGCENDECGAGEWFHLDCVGLTVEDFESLESKRLKWWCPACADALGLPKNKGQGSTGRRAL